MQLLLIKYSIVSVLNKNIYSIFLSRLHLFCMLDPRGFILWNIWNIALRCIPIIRTNPINHFIYFTLQLLGGVTYLFLTNIVDILLCVRLKWTFVFIVVGLLIFLIIPKRVKWSFSSDLFPAVHRWGARL